MNVARSDPVLPELPVTEAMGIRLMTFKNMVFDEELTLSASSRLREERVSPLQTVMMNQSPLMKGWFVVMLLNLLLFLCLMH